MSGDCPSGRSAAALGLFLAVAGSAHFVTPEPYQAIVPRPLGSPAFWVASTGVLELVCAGLVARGGRARRWGGWLAAAVFVAVFPANVKMALDGGLAGHGFPLGSPVVAWLRLPVQVPLVMWAVRVARGAAR